MTTRSITGTGQASSCYFRTTTGDGAGTSGATYLRALLCIGDQGGRVNAV
ncbi:MAG: hypothetical protein JWM19_5328 [Actinomycetia bacterium]|nr:hypothetical protein [Actinomycetes bacterium]